MLFIFYPMLHSIDGVFYTPLFIPNSLSLFSELESTVDWDTSMGLRKTASFGKAYNYSQMSYPEVPFLDVLHPLLEAIEQELGFKPNNCLINYYTSGNSRMGYHSDQIEGLAPDTGIVIVSLGATRILRFRAMDGTNTTMDYPLASGSLAYMTQDVQRHWQHAIPKANTAEPQMSLTFRQLL